MLRGTTYKFPSKDQKKTYDSPGWVLLSSSPGTDLMKKMKLVDCRQSHCIYFTKMVDRSNKLVNAHEIDCNSKKYRWRSVYSNKPEWERWFDVIPGGEEAVAFNKFCR
ncbi:hypothetical protein SynROS8604_02787 [Synechococcus sp. ROS8604]|nr:hypothetical protein SynROS8604_02787 [Synechococcus sp. ROS8604]